MKTFEEIMEKIHSLEKKDDKVKLAALKRIEKYEYENIRKKEKLMIKEQKEQQKRIKKEQKERSNIDLLKNQIKTLESQLNDLT